MNNNRKFNANDVEQIEKIIGYTFQDKDLLRLCFTLSSASAKNNERLEFLGDAVIELCITEILYLKLQKDEGDMTEIRKKFVSNDALRETVEELGLQRYLLYAGGEDNLGKKPIASLFEALAAGIYLDGGMPQAKKFVVEKLIKPKMEQAAAKKQAQLINYKGALQEYLQSRGQPRAVYTFLEKTGPDHNPVFRMLARTQGLEAIGEGKSKTAAEQGAAEQLLKLLRSGK